MLSINFANTKPKQAPLFWMTDTPLPDVGVNFPDVKISKRPNFFPSIFLDGLGRSGRSGRLSGVSCWEGNRTYFSPYEVRIGKHVLNVRTSGNESNHIFQSFQNGKVTSL